MDTLAVADMFTNLTIDIFSPVLVNDEQKQKQKQKQKKLKRSSVIQQRKDARARKSLKRSNTTVCTIPEYIMTQWIEAMEGKRKTMPVGGVPLLLCRKMDYSPWLYSTITSTYRRRAEWHAFISNMWKSPRLSEKDKPCSLNHPNPFYYSQAIAIHLDKLMCLNIALRMSVLRCVQRRLMAKMDTRVVGEDDLHTTIKIPTAAMVSVYDFKTRAKYIFHTNTILKTILASLKYCAYGIYTPKAPKNPYTNLEWTKPQLMSITQQIVCNLVGLHRIPPPLFLNYYNCNYVLHVFAKFCEKELGINAAIELFKLKDDPTTQEIYGETIDTVLEEESMTMSPRMRTMIIERKLPARLQNIWDNVVLALWIDENTQVLYEPYKTYTEIIDDFKKVWDDTRSYLIQLTRSARRPRPPPTNGSLIRTYALGVLIDAAIYTDNILEMGDEEPPLTVNL
jgi:hypothetical protein